jgi:putative ABC transport system permease protein
MRSVLSFAWRDLRGSGRSLWVFCACLALGVALIAAGGGLFRQVSDGLLADARTLFGGDLEARHNAPLQPDELDWMRTHGEVSLLIELRTMLMAADGRAHLVELQSFDERYPLYGRVDLQPPSSLAAALALRDGEWGAAIDPVLAERAGLRPGDRVELGAMTATVRALIARQPDRSLRADWSGPPVLIAAGALAATGLVQPASRVEYRYRVRTHMTPETWRAAFAAAFPTADWEVHTFGERADRLAEVIGQIGSGLLLVGFSALFIGGLGVFNSVHAYLQGKLGTLATLRALGLRDRRLARVYLAQVLMLAGAASLAGVLLGGGLAIAGTALAAERLPLASGLASLLAPLGTAWLFGVLTALGFALPALGRALSVSPAALFRGVDGAATRTPAGYWWLAAACALAVATLVLAVVPDSRFALGFILTVALVLALLEGLVRALRVAGHRLVDHPLVAGRFALRLALANLHRPGSPLRPALLSLGSALTLLVASTLVVAALMRTINDTIPERAPALAFYDIPAAQRDAFRGVVGRSAGLERLDLAPLVLGRLSRVNDESLRESADPARALEARDEHKLSYLLNNFDNVVVDRGAWWPEGYRGPPLVAMEDREADQLGLKIGDRLRFDIQGRAVDAQLVAIYSQRRFQARMWLEAIFSDGALDPFITRYVGAAYMAPGEAITAQNRLAATFPNVVTVRTEGLLREARSLLARAGAGLGVIAGVSLLASLLVLASVVTASRVRQVYDATVLHTLGARVAVIRRSLQLEYALLAVLTSAFAIATGSAIALALLQYRLQLEAENVWWLGAVTALAVSVCSLGLGARYLLARLRLAPALLLRSGG